MRAAASRRPLREFPTVNRGTGRLVTWNQARERLGVSRDTVLRRAREVLRKLMPRSPVAAREAVLAGGGVQFEMAGCLVTIRRPGSRNFKVWLMEA